MMAATWSNMHKQIKVCLFLIRGVVTHGQGSNHSAGLNIRFGMAAGTFQRLFCFVRNVINRATMEWNVVLSCGTKNGVVLGKKWTNGFVIAQQKQNVGNIDLLPSKEVEM